MDEKENLTNTVIVANRGGGLLETFLFSLAQAKIP